MIWLYAGFILFVLVMLALDLGVFNRKAHVISAKEAMCWTAFFVTLAVTFSVAVYFIYENHWFGIGLDVPQIRGERKNVSGWQATVEFLTGYVVEYSLSMDNIFVIALIFAHFRVPAIYQHRVLFWGILGALLMRGAMIALGAELLQRYDWITYIFGAFLLITGAKILFTGEKEVEIERNFALRMARKIYPVSSAYHGKKFFVVENGRRAMTPLFLALIVVEFTDLVFAVDSIPAIFGITLDPFIVFTSNVFAILGLRSLYFALAALINRFHHLGKSLALVLIYVGAKMLLARWYHPEPLLSLGIIVGILGVGVLASLFLPAASEPVGNKHEKNADDVTETPH